MFPDITVCIHLCWCTLVAATVFFGCIMIYIICIAWTMPTKLLSTYVTQTLLDSSELECVQVQENTNVSSPTKQMTFVKRKNLMDQWRNAGYSLCRIQWF